MSEMTDENAPQFIYEKITSIQNHFNASVYDSRIRDLYQSGYDELAGTFKWNLAQLLGEELAKCYVNLSRRMKEWLKLHGIVDEYRGKRRIITFPVGVPMLRPPIDDLEVCYTKDLFNDFFYKNTSVF
jgi:hypothetical protein